MKKNYVTPLEYIYVKSGKEYGEHMTIPSQSMTVYELMRRHRAGTLESISKSTIYESEGDYEEDITKDPAFDLADVTDILEDAKIKRRKVEEAAEAKRAEAKRKQVKAKEPVQTGGAIPVDETQDEPPEDN